MALYVWIKRGTGSTTDYGPQGLNVVQAIQGETSGPGVNGKATIHLFSNAAYYDIRKGDLVKIFESSNGGTTVDDWAFGGFVEDVERDAEKGTRIVWYVITCQDANVQLDWLRLQVPANGGWLVNDGGVTRLDLQLHRICSTCTTNTTTTCTFDDASGMALRSGSGPASTACRRRSPWSPPDRR